MTRTPAATPCAAAGTAPDRGAAPARDAARRHVFRDDALGRHDGVALAGMVARGDASAQELAAAALARATGVAGLGAVASSGPTVLGDPEGPLAGVPTYVKDNVDVAAMPTGQGSAAFRALPALRHAPVTGQLLDIGLTILGKSRMPEFGLNASTEFTVGEPARNPWSVTHTAGASSGGAAVLVASGVVPLAHANDGGGSIRIPAACCGLVGLKPGRGRICHGRLGGSLPIEVVTEGVLTRTVRDAAAFLAAADSAWHNPALPPVGRVEGPSGRRLRIGLVLVSPLGAPACGETVAAVLGIATALQGMGHHVEPVALPFGRPFAEDVLDYWGMLAFLAVSTGRWLLDRRFDGARTEGLTRGLCERYRRAAPRTPAVLHRLRRAGREYEAVLRRHDVLLSPVLGHVTPPLGRLHPDVPIETLLDRLAAFAAHTPLSNVAGTPAIAVPAGLTAGGLPVGVQFGAATGGERTLLDVAYAVEAAVPFPRIDTGPAAGHRTLPAQRAESPPGCRKGSGEHADLERVVVRSVVGRADGALEVTPRGHHEQHDDQRDADDRADGREDQQPADQVEHPEREVEVERPGRRPPGAGVALAHQPHEQRSEQAQ